MADSSKVFNIVVLGVGGQGLITLLKILSEAAFIGGHDVKTSELHGLSQRGGSVSVHIRFGQEVLSPLVPQGKADLIISLEQQESLNGLYFANKDTVFLINQHETPTMTVNVSKDEVEKELQNFAVKNYFLPASEICQKELGNEVVSGVYLLGYAVYNNFLPIEAELIKRAIKAAMPEKHRDLNIKAFDLGRKKPE